MPKSNNVLLGMRLKRTARVDLKGQITAYIKRVYGAHAASEAEEELDSLQDMRNTIAAAGTASQGAGLDLFAKYYYALKALEMRFPVSSDSSHVNISFKWHDAFVESQTCSQKNIHFEKAAVLFCMAAAASQKGMETSRDTEAGIMEAVKSYAQAAGILKHLRENVSLKTDTPRSVDISAECCQMLEQLMLAQAQEVFYELAHRKAVSGTSKFTAATLACVAAAVASMYSDVASLYNRTTLVRHFNREWGESTKCKSILYSAEADQLQGRHIKQSGGGSKQGLYLAHLQRAAATLKASKKEFRTTSDMLQKQFKELQEALDQECAQAEKDNFNIYMQLVPKEIAAVSTRVMVSAKDPSSLLQRDEQWFTDIVPEKVTRNLSKYTSSMEEVVRALLGRLDSATDDARTAMVKHDLPGVLDAMNPGKKPELPERLVVALQDSFVSGGPAPQLRGAAQNLHALRQQAQQSLQQCTDVLDEEARQDQAARSTWKDAWTRPQSNVLAGSLRESIAKYTSNLQSAADSDRQTLAQLEANGPRLEAIAVQSVTDAMPTLQPAMVATASADPAIVTGSLRQAIAALDSLSQERGNIEERIKAARNADNILPDLLKVGPEGTDAVIQRHLAAYEVFKADIDRNTGRQAELLSVIAHNMSAFRQVYDVSGWASDCEKVADRTIEDIKLGNELLTKLNEGVVWYTGMQDSVNKLKTMCTDFQMGRQLDLDERTAELKKAQDSKSAAAAAEAAKTMQAMDIGFTGASGTSDPSPRPMGPPGASAPDPTYPPPPDPVVQGQSPYPGYSPYGYPPPHGHPGHAAPVPWQAPPYGAPPYGAPPYGVPPYGVPQQAPMYPPPYGHGTQYAAPHAYPQGYQQPPGMPAAQPPPPH